MDLLQSLWTYWPFSAAGIIVFTYALYLIHSKTEIGIGHSILVVSAMLIALAPFISVKVGTDGTLELQRLANLRQATQETVVGVGELQSRLEKLAAETERRLSALEITGTSSPNPTSSSSALPAIVSPPDHAVRALDNPQAIIDALQGGWIETPDNSRLPKY